MNSLDRPGTEEWVPHANESNLNKIAQILSPLDVEIIAKFQSRTDIGSYNSNIEDQIIATIERRPCTDEDLCTSLGLKKNELNKYLDNLLKEKKIVPVNQKRGIFFKPNN